MEVGDSTCWRKQTGAQTWVVVPLFKRGTGECVPTTEGSHFSTSQEDPSGYWRGEFGYSRPLDSGGTMRFSSWWWKEHWTSSIPSTGCWRVYREFAQPVHMCFVDLEARHSTHVPQYSVGSAPRWGPRGPLLRAVLSVLFIIFMDRISKRSQGPEGVWFGNHRISSLLFAMMMLSCWLLQARTSSSMLAGAVCKTAECESGT
ncbi:hypothetical protein L3Q82_015788 [Scortum barcoo]|uniref:Uncharacterized protein n=1 Tax=Scortum barcoo TaxID=214431 RepID=A0ACB8VPB2_9TELE|nr:hypothetical protein L3Q82_015788 [Scortum barcoo]